MESVQQALAGCRTLDACPAPVEARSFAEVLQLRAAMLPDEFAYAFLGFGRQPDLVMRYGDMHRRALSIAHELMAHGQAGDPVLLVFPSAFGFLEAFFACLYAGRVAVPALPPRTEKEARRLVSITRDCKPVTMLSMRHDQEPALTVLRRELGQVPPSLALEDLPDREGAADLPDVSPQATAFLQYTSGSTSEPKGVMVGHANLLHNERVIQRQFKSDEGRYLVVSWLPHYHDMGLIGGLLQPIFTGRPALFMSPQDFLQQPARWLQTISTFGATQSGGPNFAYELCARRAHRMKLDTLDLSTWQHAFNGSEPVRHETLKQFADAFAPTGFRLDRFAPCYGLAEVTLMASSKLKGDGVLCRRADISALAAGRFAEAGESDPASLLVSVGQLDDTVHAIRVIDEHTGESLPAGKVGEICVASESVCQGYFAREALSEATFRAYRSQAFPQGFLRTGDLGFVDGQGHLFVTGRIKDLIILNGANYYPQDIEQVVQNMSDAIRPGRVVAFMLEGHGQSGVVVAFEAMSKFELAAVAPAMVEQLWAACQLTPAALVRTGKGSIPLTSSGKVQRSACRTLLESGKLPIEDAHLCVPSDTWIGTLAAKNEVREPAEQSP